MDDVFSMLMGILTNDYESADKAGRSEINGYTVDTCCTNDFGWETAVWYGDNSMVIVERYPDKEEATKGHEKWCEFCKTEPTSVWSVQLDCEKDLR